MWAIIDDVFENNNNRILIGIEFATNSKEFPKQFIDMAFDKHDFSKTKIKIKKEEMLLKGMYYSIYFNRKGKPVKK